MTDESDKTWLPVLFLVGILLAVFLGGVVARWGVSVDCREMGATIVNGTVLDCKERRK